jgi:hypothetical protein
MAGIRSLTRLTLAAAMFAALPALAGDDGTTFEFRLRAGLTAGALRQDQGDNKAMGFGVAARRAFGKGHLTAELSYDILAGQARDRMPLAGPVYAPAGAALGTADPVTHNAYFLRVNESIDLRKESASGFSLKGGYSAPLGLVSGMSWHGGLSLDFYKTSSEFTGTLRPMVLVGAAPTQVVDAQNRKYYEGFATVAKGTSLTPGLYLGLRQQLSEDFSLELNLRNFGAKHYDYKPTTYTGAPAVMDSSTHRGFVFEISLAMTL